MPPHVQIAFRKNDGRVFSRFIQWWTNSIYSHCEIVLDGWCYSSSWLDGGVRKTTITLSPDKWDVVEISWANKEKILRYFAETDSHKYGVFSLLRNQLFNRNKSIKESQFCSEWCANALGLPNAVSLSPSSLHTLCLYLNKLYEEKL